MKNFFRRYENKLFFLILTSLSIFYGVIAVWLHYKYQTFGWDLGFFDQLIWKASRFLYPFSSLNKVNILANHFSPILFMYAPLYWVWSSPYTLLFAQAVTMVFAAYPLYLLAIHKTKNRFFSYSIVFSYLFFIGTQWSILNEFHETTVMPLFIALLFLSLDKKHKNLFWLSLVGILMIKEEFALLAASFGLTIAFHFRKRAFGLMFAVFSLVFFFFLTNFFMPFISEKGIYQHPHISSEAKTPSEFAVKIVSDPLFGLFSLFNPPQKINTFLGSILSFGLLPIFAPIPVLIPVIEQFLTRFLYTGPQWTVWQNVNHHAAPLSMLLPVSSIYGAMIIKNKLLNQKNLFLYLSLILIIATITQDILFKAPIHSVFKRQFYEIPASVNDNNKLINILSDLPNNIPIATQNSFFPHLSQREKIYLLPEINDAEFIVVDFVDGPNKFAPLSYIEFRNLINNLLISGEFRLMNKQGGAMILVKNNIFL